MAGCGGGWQLGPEGHPEGGAGAALPALDACESPLDASPPAGYPQGLHVVGNHFEDAAGNKVILHGVNRSGSEYKCVQSGGFFDGPCNDASTLALSSWKVNAVRVPLNESCWLGINGAPPEYAGENYKAVIGSYVKVLHKHNLIPILELHWAAPGAMLAGSQLPMPNADHTPDLWKDVATTFLDDKGVVFEPFNEPFPDANKDSDAAWQCWRDGCVTSTDPGGNVAASWHIYNNNPCADAACWDGAPASLASKIPIVATEIGENDCLGTFVTPLMQWLDQHGGHYLAWSWNAAGPCTASSAMQGGSPFSLVTDYVSATPNSVYAQTFYDHLRMP
jgi:endoglucanase